MRADFVVTAVKTTEEGGHQGLSFLLVEKEMEGYKVSKKLEKLGWHASDTAELAFDDVFVPDENLLGEENKGFYLIMANFQWERLVMALGAVAAMGRMVERTVEYAGERKAFGKPIGKHQAIRHKIAEMAVEARGRSRRSPTTRCACSPTARTRSARSRGQAATQRAAFEVADDAACRSTAAPGYMKEYEIERAVRDTRLGPIGGGTDEIMKEILGEATGTVSAFVLIPGAGGDSYYWHLVVPVLERGRASTRCVAVDLPTGDDAAGAARVRGCGAGGDRRATRDLVDVASDRTRSAAPL